MIKKSTKYLNSFKDIEQYYSKPQTKQFKNEIIQNGNKYPYQIKRKVYIYQNTSQFDSIVELFSRAIKNYKSFKNDCIGEQKISNNVFLNTVINYSSESNMSTLHKNRFNILFQHQTVSRDVIVPDEKISILLDKVMRNCYSIKQTLFCYSCNIKKVYFHCSICPNSTLNEDQLCELPKHVDLISGIKIYQCEACKGNMTEIINFKNYLAIDMEEHDTSFNIEEIPIDITIKNNEFILTGVIRFVPPVKNCTLKHYIAYSRNVTGKWKSYDNLKTKSEDSPKKNIQLAMMLYILKERSTVNLNLEK